MRTSLARRFALSLLAALLAIAVAPGAFANGILVIDPGTGPTQPPTERIRPPTLPEPQRFSPVRLKSHRVSAQVVDQTAEFTVEQTFHSDSNMQLEGTYLFPLPEGAAVGKFAMTMGGKMVEGAVVEANEARRIYQSIVSRRRDPGLLEYMGRGLFQARVFPIMPNSDLTIRLVFQMVLRDDAGTLELRYPLGSERLNGQPVEEVVMDVKVESSVDLKGLWSPSHEVAVTRDGERKARVSFERTGRRQDKDFVLYLGRSPEAVGFSLVSSKAAGEDGTFMAVFAPRQTATGAEIAPKDIIYVVDTSGSMAGEKMVQAQKALKLGVSMLRAGDRFNIVSFATSLSSFREGLVEASADVKAAATQWVDALQAVGGTNIEGALDAALRAQATGRLPLVVFITDGRPTVGERDTEALLKRALGANAAKARIFTFGVGHDLDVGLLDRLAEATNGIRDYVTPGEDIELVTGRFFTKVDRPVMTDLTVELGSGVSDVYPQRIPDLFAGGQVVLFGRYKIAPQGDTGERTLLLRGKMGGKEIVFEHRGTLNASGGPGWLARLWGHRKVAFLLDEIRLRGESRELVEEVIRLATRYAIVTPYTAGLVVEDGELEERGIRSANPLSQLGGARERLRLPSLREPRDGAPPPALGGLSGPASGGGFAPGSVAPPSTPAPMPAPTPDPSYQPKQSEELKRLKDKTADDEKADAGDGYGKLRERVQSVGTRSFVKKQDGRWVDTAFDGKSPTTKVEAYSEAWMALMAKGDEVARILALGEHVVFVLEGTAYEVTPPAGK